MAAFLAKIARAAKKPSRLLSYMPSLSQPAHQKPDQNRMALLHQMPKRAICAEIGVWKGDFSEQILSVTDPIELHLVDPWVFAPHYPRRWYGGIHAKNQRDMDAIAREVEQKFGLDERVAIHRMPSQQFFAQAISFDWVYIDGDHSQAAVLADLRAAWGAVRPGGFITGDDYLWRDADGSYPIKLALKQFARDTRVQIHRNGGQFAIAKPQA